MFRRYGQWGWPLVVVGVLCTMMSLGSTWGVAYGQTGGPTPTPAGAVLGVSKTVDDTTVAPGDPVIFTIQVTNTGDGVAREVVVEDNVPSAFVVQNATTTAGTPPVVSGQLVSVTIPELAPGASVLITITTEARESADGATVNQVNARGVNVTGGTLTSEDSASVEIDESNASPAPSATANPSATTKPSATANPSATAAPSATPRASEQPSKLPDTGTAPQPQWALLVIGLGIAAAGVTLVLRTRAEH